MLLLLLLAVVVGVVVLMVSFDAQRCVPHSPRWHCTLLVLAVLNAMVVDLITG